MFPKHFDSSGAVGKAIIVAVLVADTRDDCIGVGLRQRPHLPRSAGLRKVSLNAVESPSHRIKRAAHAERVST